MVETQSLSFRVLVPDRSPLSRASSYDRLSASTDSFEHIAPEDASDEERIVYPKSVGPLRAFPWADEPQALHDPDGHGDGKEPSGSGSGSGPDEDFEVVVLDPRPNGAFLVAVGSAPLSRPVTDPAALAAAMAQLDLSLDLAAPPPRFPIDEQAAPAPATTSGVSPHRRGRKPVHGASAAPVTSATVAPPASAAGSKRKSKKAKRAARKATANPGAVVPAPAGTAPTERRARKRKVPQPAVAASPNADLLGEGLGGRIVVEDDLKGGLVSALYEEAVRYITSFLKDPADPDRRSRLHLLQALIIELGICTPAPASSLALPDSSPASAPCFAIVPDLPRTLTAATSLLKARAFVNVRDYLSVREQGLSALRRVMHPSRQSLVRDLRARRGRRAPLQWIKESGLGVLLVSSWH